MTKFNSKQTNTTVNLAGGDAYVMTPEYQFATMVLTSFVKDQYYRSESEGLEKVKELLDQISPTFAAKTAVYARQEFGMRSISHVVAAEIAKKVKGEKWTKNFYNKVVHRVDDITEILSYYISNYSKPVPNSLKRGLGMAFGKFDEYQLAKYRGEGNEISLVDAVNLLHPTPTEKNKVALKKLIEDKLKSVDTWEAKLSATGSAEDKDEAKKEAWTELIESKKIGYFALLRNLRNIMLQAPELLDKAGEILLDKDLQKKSLVLPFRFQTAIEQFKEESGKDARKIISILSKAAEMSLDNVPVFDGDTLVIVDKSGSMEGRPAQIASLFASILVKKNNADVIVFSDNAKYVSINTQDSLTSIAESFDFESGGTNFAAPFLKANQPYDRIIILSDMQGWAGDNMWGNDPKKAFADYKKRTGANPRIYSFDLQGYGTLEFPQQNVYAMAGFSDKVFDVMKLLEQDRNALINTIEAVQL
ncbi:MAG: hypothetical protein KCHDKBKB_00615 [Elusimicrobia bacterium]|nr:hypothetical protein [Elusimicrobiota bacterium]